MPVIPYAQQGQRLTPSAPVALASSEAARGPGEAIASFGKAMFTLGDVLDKADKASQREMDQLAAEKALQEARGKLLPLEAHQSASAIDPKDTDSMGAVDRFSSEFDKVKSEIGKTLGNERQRAYFENKFGDLQNDARTRVYAGEVKKRVDAIEIMRAETLAQRGALVDVLPEELPFALADNELSIRNSETLSDAEKQSKIYLDNKELTLRAINGQARRENFVNAQMIFENNLDKFSAEEADKLAKDLKSQKGAADHNALMAMDREARENARSEKQKQDATMAQATREFIATGQSPEGREAVLRQYSGLLEPDRLKALNGMNVFNDNQDETIESRIIGRVVSGKLGVDAAIVLVNASNGKAGSNGISPKKATDLLTRLNSWKESEQANSKYKALVGPSVKLIEDMKSTDILSIMDKLGKVAHIKKVNQAIIQFHSEMMERPGSDPRVIANKIMKENLGETTFKYVGKIDAIAIQESKGLLEYKTKYQKESLVKIKNIKDKKLQNKAALKLQSELKMIDSDIELKQLQEQDLENQLKGVK